MRNIFFRQATALVVGLLVISPGPAFSLTSNGANLNNLNNLNNGNALESNNQLLISQESISVGVAVAVAVRVLDKAVVVTQTVAKRVPVNVPSQHRDIILPKLRQAQQSMAKAQTSAQKGDNAQVATAVSQAVSFMGEAAAVAQADAGSVQAITRAIVKANEAIAVAQGRS